MPSYADLVGPELSALTGRQAPAPFACLRVHGPDAVTFVHRLCTQDVQSMQPGEARPAAFLSAKGKLETLAWVGRALDAVWLEAQAHEVAKLAQLLERYHFSERLAIVSCAAWHSEQIVGPQAWDGSGAAAPGLLVNDGETVFAGQTNGLTWLRRYRATAAPTTWQGATLDETTWQILRIAAALPWVGIDADATNLGIELEIDDHVSLTKGCYTGQEIVARIHTYGHTNRRLCRVRWSQAGAAIVGSKLADADGEEVGKVTSAAELPQGGGGLGLAMVPHLVGKPGEQLLVAGSASIVTVC